MKETCKGLCKHMYITILWLQVLLHDYYKYIYNMHYFCIPIVFNWSLIFFFFKLDLLSDISVNCKFSEKLQFYNEPFGRQIYFSNNILQLKKQLKVICMYIM